MIEPWLDEWWEYIEKADKSLALDIGANAGTWSTKLITMFDKVVSFEPDTRCDPPSGIEYDRRGIWNQTTPQTFYYRSSPLQSSLLDQHPVGDTNKPIDIIGERTISCVCLDDIAEEYGSPTFIKMDIEGAEVQALEGATKKCFSKCHWLIEIHDTFISVVQNLKRLGFSECKVIDHPSPLAAEGHKWIYVQPQE